MPTPAAPLHAVPRTDAPPRADALPPFDALVAFEAILRRGSLTSAAEELAVTQSAISHRLRKLESFMGTALLERHSGVLRATAAGEALGASLAQLLAGLATLRPRVQAAASPNRLRVGVGAALAQNWLVRRLPGFASSHPELSIELVVADNEAPERAADLDVRILWVPAELSRATPTQLPLFQEQVFPVCHPSLLPPGRAPDDPAVLAALPLLHKGRPGRDDGAEWSWAAWFQRLGLPGAPREALRFASIGPAITAAHERAGVVLARSMLVQDALTEGRLVRVLPPRFDRPSSKAHLVRWAAGLGGDPRVAGFARWLAARASETMNQ